MSYNASSIVDRHVESGRAGKPAFIAHDATLTYEQLRKQVNRAGGLLRELGVGREHRVLLVLDDTTAFPIMFLGAMRIGAVPVPVSTMMRPDGLAELLRDSRARFLALTPEFAETEERRVGKECS